MDRVKRILGQFENAAHHPGQMVREWKQETGRKVVGCLPVHSSGAEELIHAASAHYQAISLSVSLGNPARRLYERLGFELVRQAGDSFTLMLKLDPE